VAYAFRHLGSSTVRIGQTAIEADDLALIAGKPELAKVVADASRTTVVRTVSLDMQAFLDGKRPADAIEGVEYYGGWIEITVTVHTLLGFVLFKWMHHGGFCADYDVGVITRWQNRYDRLIEADATIVTVGLVGNWANPLPASPPAVAPLARTARRSAASNRFPLRVQTESKQT
jgi:hypothetical protein